MVKTLTRKGWAQVYSPRRSGPYLPPQIFATRRAALRDACEVSGDSWKRLYARGVRVLPATLSVRCEVTTTVRQAKGGDK
jgi:hypothetical protein